MKKKKIGIAVVSAILAISLLPISVSAQGLNKENWPTVGTGYITSGGYVSALQADLWSSGYQSTVGNVDGIFGSATRTAVESFQTGEGLTSDGVVGSNTWSAFEDYNLYDSPNTRIYRHPGSTTYEVYYSLGTDSVNQWVYYYLRYRSNGYVVSSGPVWVAPL